jgi:hypothetical protein
VFLFKFERVLNFLLTFGVLAMTASTIRDRLLLRLVVAVALAAGAAIPAHAQLTWTNYTTGSGLGNNSVLGVYASGSTIYAATNGGGLSIGVTAVSEPSTYAWPSPVWPAAATRCSAIASGPDTTKPT